MMRPIGLLRQRVVFHRYDGESKEFPTSVAPANDRFGSNVLKNRSLPRVERFGT